jgi:acetyl esterase/lipase
MKNTIKKIIWKLVGLIIAIVITGGADWAGDVNPRDPIISPLYGEMKGLPPTDLFTGTWEIFYTDIVKTCDKMKAAGVDVHLHVAEKMGHVYPLWPCPEGSSARKEIAEIIMQ